MKSRPIIILVLVLLIVIFGLLILRVFYLQRYCGRRYRMDFKKQQHVIITEKPRRGIILDHGGRVLAASNRVDTVFADPGLLLDAKLTEQIAERLGGILDLPGYRICEIIYGSSNPGFVKIKQGLTPAQRDAIKSAGLRGIGIQSNWERFYPMGAAVSHPVGFLGVDRTGLAGIEQRYDRRLRGTAGRNVLFVDALRKPIGAGAQTNIVQDGLSLVLTIDATIQQFVRAALDKQLRAYRAESAVGIVMDPWTGAVLAMVSLPDFEPAQISKAQPSNLRNRAVTDPFEPGSIFKPIVAAIALDNDVIDYDETIFCENGSYHGRGFGRIGEWGDHQFGDLSIRQIISQSSNIGMAKIGQKTGAEKIYEGVKLFGFGSMTGIDLPGEDAGQLRPLEKWNGYSITRVPYGHEISVTAIQITRAYCVFANGGRIVTPHIVKFIVDRDGEVTDLFGGQSLAGYIVKPQVARWIVTEALVDVVKFGTGTKAALQKWQVFGKTGTANIAGKGYDETNYVASFIGGAPAERPAVVVLVAIRKPDKSLGKGYSGGTVAAPVVKEILSRTLTYLQR